MTTAAEVRYNAPGRRLGNKGRVMNGRTRYANRWALRRLILFAFAALLRLPTDMLPSFALLPCAEKAPADAPPADSHSDPLPPGAMARIGTTRLRHGDKVCSLANSPDGKRITSTDGYSVGVWDPRTGRCLAFRMLPPQYTIWWPVVSPDGTLIACRLGNGALGVQETESGKVRCDLGCKDSRIYSLAFSNDNRWLVSSVPLRCRPSLWDVSPDDVKCSAPIARN